MTYRRYSVPPFSLPSAEENFKRLTIATNPCALCGKPIKNNEWKHAAIVTENGQKWGDGNSDPTKEGYLGEWPVCGSCHENYSIASK